MATSWQCPVCRHFATIGERNVAVYRNRFTVSNRYGTLIFRTEVIACPNPQCLEITVHAAMSQPEHKSAHSGLESQWLAEGDQIREWPLIPASRAKAMPSCVPPPIVQDYNEACAIEHLSAKASATIARRCVQQIIRGYFKVSEKNLYEEIQAIKGRLRSDVWQAVDALRDIGNIGAHGERDINTIIDVEPDEAGALIRLVEILVEETYVADDREQRELADVLAIAASKKALKQAANTVARPQDEKNA